MQLIRSKAVTVAGVIMLAIACLIPQLAFAGSQSGDLAAGQVSSSAPSISYQAHIRGANWDSAKADGATAGTGAAIDALTMQVSGVPSGAVRYQVYIKNSGWQAVKSNGKSAGKISSKAGIEAVRVALVGDISTQYDVQYRVKAQGSGMQGWVSNGAIAGSVGKGKLIDAFEVSLVKKEQAATVSGDGIVDVRYKVKSKKTGWNVWSASNKASGKSSKSRPATSFKAVLNKGGVQGTISYRVKPVGGKWKGWKANGKATGTYNSLEAVKIKLSGAIASKYDVVYRVKVRGTGWLRRTMNGGVAGAPGRGKQIQQIKVQLVPKSSRSGWLGKNANWKYYENGVAVKNQWVKTKESPINTLKTSKQYYWLDSSGALAVNRVINPSNSYDSNAKYKALATEYGYVVRSKTMWVEDLNGWYAADKKGALTPSTDSRAKHIERYVKWAIAIAEDDSHGYSQFNRWGPNYDCSSLVVASLSNTGFAVGGATYTGNMRSSLTAHGFRWHTDFSDLQRGDILLVHNSSRQHTEIYLGNGQTVGAHIAENGTIHGRSGDQTGHEIDVGPYYSIWSGYLRYKG